jgi:hypothetical protein
VFFEKRIKNILKIKQWFKEGHVAPNSVPNPMNTPINLEM